MNKEKISENVIDAKYSSAKFDKERLKEIFLFKNDSNCLTFQKEKNKMRRFSKDDAFFKGMSEYISFIKTDLVKKKIDVEEKCENEFSKGGIFLKKEEIKD